jgi:hypothetical protein
MAAVVTREACEEIGGLLQCTNNANGFTIRAG